jgi:hypothetical protein
MRSRSIGSTSWIRSRSSGSSRSFIIGIRSRISCMSGANIIAPGPSIRMPSIGIQLS